MLLEVYKALSLISYLRLQILFHCIMSDSQTVVCHYRDQACFSIHKHLLDPRVALKSRVLTMPKGLADLSVSKNMFDRYHCLKSFSENFGKTHRKVRFYIPIVTWAVKPIKI